MTSFLSQISLVAAMAAINNMIRKYGALDTVFGQEQYAQIPMAVVGIVMKFFQIVISIVVGMAAGCIPVVGFNMGAKKPARVKELFTKLLLAEAAVGVVALVLVEGFPRQLIALFGAANESVYYTDFAVRSFRIYLCMIILACVNKACFIFLQAMGKAGGIHERIHQRLPLVFQAHVQFTEPHQPETDKFLFDLGLCQLFFRNAGFKLTLGFFELLQPLLGGTGEDSGLNRIEHILDTRFRIPELLLIEGNVGVLLGLAAP